MHIVLRSAQGDRDLTIDARPGATVDDLLRSVVGSGAPASIAVDGRAIPGHCLLADAGLYEGAVLSVAPDAVTDRASPPHSGLELVIVAGRSAGTGFPLTVGRSSVGREAGATIVLADAAVSGVHCIFELDSAGSCTVVDNGSANGTFVDGREATDEAAIEVREGAIVELGSFALALRKITVADRPVSLDLRRHIGADGTTPFNRPPRSALSSAMQPFVVPTEPGRPPKPLFSVASTVGPLVMAIVLVAMTKNLQYALVALLSPLIAVGGYYESRRRATKGGQRTRTAYESELGAFRRRMRGATAAERARLQAACPDTWEVLRRAALPSVRLWERRPRDDDFLVLSAGLADLPWQPPLKERGDGLPEDSAQLLAANKILAAPACVDLSNGGVVGIVGDRDVALALARNLVCQAAVHHGPADLTIGVFVDPARTPDWDWCKWLPHTRANDATGQRWLSDSREHSDALLRRLAAGAGTGTVLAVLDSDLLTEGNAPARDLLRAVADARAATRHGNRIAVAGIEIATSSDRLHSACNTVIQIDSSAGDATMLFPAKGRKATHKALLAGLELPAAGACARDLARFDDPELARVDGGLPDSVRLLDLLALEHIDAGAIRDRWGRGGLDPGAVTPLGVTASGVFELDLARDGPHGLVGGTTGSGKSELLKSLVAGLAASTDPEHLTFILIDFKGGAAFADCARLPHTVGMVTDLDESLITRALEALRAEIQYRKRVLLRAGASDLKRYLAGSPAEPMPRLVVVIDEFAAMLTAEHLTAGPELLAALVSVAAQGRALGVHLVLATQRPRGAVNEDIRTNTNLRIALRVQDAEDSMDVIDRRDAAELSRHRPGRAYVRLGQGEVVPIQTAYLAGGDDAGAGPQVAATPFTFGPPPPRRQAAPSEPDGHTARAAGASDLERLVDAIGEAMGASGIAPPRRPWPEPLPAQIDLDELLAAQPPRGSTLAVAALADDPRGQTQYPVGWELAEGNLLLYGIPGSGTTTTLATLGLSLAATFGPDELELFAFDYDAGELAALEALPHTGAVVLGGDRERQMRLIRHLRAELERRRTAGAQRRTVVLIDNLAAMRAEFDDVEGLELMDALTRVYADGRAAGIWFAVTADRLTTVPGAWAAVTTQKWLFRLTDPYDYVYVGLDRRDAPPALAGRAVMTESRLQIQVGRPRPSLEVAAAKLAARYPAPAVAPARIHVLPDAVSLDDVPATSQLASEPWRIPFGVRESDLGAAELVLYQGEHALVAGPARSGKSVALWTIAESLRRNGDGGGVHVAAVGGPRSPLGSCPAVDSFARAGGEATALFARLRTLTGPVVVLIDDAEAFDDTDDAIANLIKAAAPQLHVVAAGRADSLRSAYGHWTKNLARSRVGVLLKPNIDLDGDLLGANLPRRAPVRMVVGRGYAAHNGEIEIVQVAVP